MGGHQLDGPVGVAGQRGLADLAMLVGSVATDGTGRQRRRPVPVELGRVEQLAADPLERGAAGGRAQGGVVRAVHGHPAQVRRAVLEVGGRAGEPMVGRDDVGLPVDVALGDRLAQGERLDLDADPGQVAQVRQREGSDPEPALRGGLDEVLRRQSSDRFTHDAQTHVVLLGEVPQLDP